MSLIYLVAGARPNFMKIAPIARALERNPKFDFKIIHTGQHYDRDMSDVFFEELGLPQPDVFFAAGGGSHSEQTAKILIAFEEYCQATRPDGILVVGDVNSTMACSIVAKKLLIPVGHVEAGLRSGDLTMPEEVNRVVTDSICDWFFVTEPSGVENLLREGKPRASIHHVGNVMVDTLNYQADKLAHTAPYSVGGSIKRQLKASHGRYGVITLHRPSNVDNVRTFARIAEAVREVSVDVPLVFPVHPRTRTNMDNFGITFGPRVTLFPPLSYMSFLDLWKDAMLVLTDSGGLQEETTALGVPCVTLRDNTERPLTIEQGTNVLAGTDPARIVCEAQTILDGRGKRGQRPKLWDGRAAERIVGILATELT